MDTPVSGTPGGVTSIDLSAFGEGEAAKQRRGLQNLPIVLAGVVIVVAGFAALIFIWYLVDTNVPGAERSGLSAAAFFLIVLGLCIWAIYVVIRRRSRWDSGTGELISERDFSRAQLKRPVPHAGLTLSDLLARLRGIAAGFGSEVTVQQTDPKKLASARNWRIVAWALIGAGLLIFFFASVVLGVVVAFSSILAFVRSARVGQPSLNTVRAQDKRLPILLLRSFRDDGLTAPARFRYGPFLYTSNRRFEQAIAGSFQSFGPLIAIGEPNEKLPQFGAARTYLAGDEWQKAVLGWIDEARLIVMIAGTTQWIVWELQRILEQDQYRRLLILMPPDPARAGSKTPARAERWRNVCAAFEGTAWAPALQGVDTAGLLLVQLEASGGILAIRSSAGHVQDYLLAIGIAINQRLGSGSAG